MAKNPKKALKEKFSMEFLLPKYVGYCDYYLGTQVPVRLRNDSEEALTLTVRLEGNDLFVPFEETAQIPFESSVEFTAEGVFSPRFLAENDELTTVTANVAVYIGEDKLTTLSSAVSALPFDWWEGLDGNAERVAAFVRPRLSECSRVLEDAGKRLKKQNADNEFYGYSGTDKNTVRQIAAAVYAAIKGLAIEKSGETDLSRPLCAARDGLLKERVSTSFRLAVFAAACLESANLHPVIALGKNSVAVGVWLYDSCFLDPVTDDEEIVLKYVSDGINNLAFFDTEDLFTGNNAAFTPSGEHFRQKLKAGYFECFVDIQRCRLGRIVSCPVRGRGLDGYEIYTESEEGAPEPLPEFGKLSLEEKLPKNKIWERRLLDLTSRNTLLDFKGKNAVHLSVSDADALVETLSEKPLRLKGGAVEKTPFGAELTRQEKDLVALEMKKGVVRTYQDAKTTAESAVKLLRKNREADEETGAKILYLAFGFLAYSDKESKEPHRAPIVLAPVELKRAKGNEDFSVASAEGEYFVNSTLLEFLKQEYNIDVRGLGGNVLGLKISEILAMFRAETASMKGWEVVTDTYLSVFSFQRYLMWNDLRTHFRDFQKNALVNALLKGRAVKEDAEGGGEDDIPPEEVLTPMPSDSSQYSAVALSGKDVSFVLHGPPGTGKSQTITNIIANALYRGKRVLFVAEKKAALDVVKKRLDSVGLGDFCLELHSSKTDKSDVLRHMEHTLSLPKEERSDAFETCASEYAALRRELRAPMEALHKKRRLGVSVYEAILHYLSCKDAPDILDIESSFYDTLDEKKLSECRSMILSAAAAAKECGGVNNSPFENVNLYEYSQELKDRLDCSCEVLLTEIKHLKAFLALFLEFYRQKISTLTPKKLGIISEIAQELKDGVYDKYFSDANEAEFYVFYNANRRFDVCYGYYRNHFRSLIDLDDKEYAELQRFAETGGDYKLSRVLKAVKKNLDKAALHPLADEDMPKYFETLVEIFGAIERMKTNTALGKAFFDRSGRIVYRRRTEFMQPLYALHEKCASAFLDYNPDAFNGMCIRASNGYTMPVIEGYLKAAESFLNAEEAFLECTNADRSKIKGEDVIDYYSAKAGALIDNLDMLPNWCMYKATGKKLSALGLNFISDALESGKLKGENVLAGFEKNVYKNFLEINIPADADLSRMTVGTLEETVEKFRMTQDEFVRLTRERIRARLIANLPSENGALSVEVSAFTRLSKSNLRGSGIRGLFSEVPTLSARVNPCLLMSPSTVAQYLQPTADEFDLVIFDEASQMSTAEAVGSIARAKKAIVVGDPKQLPPTTFFKAAYVDEDNLENEDLESVLDDCLALGLPERHLDWHYRSKHESLIAFSNAMYYDNRLCTFPSPDALESKVKFVEVNGTYDRGFTKRNVREAEALVKEVVRRLSDPVLSRSSIGIVTFSNAQKEALDSMLNRELSARKLDGAAYDREEPLFVKNLENVQGDERDVILFSVCYGPDAAGRVSLNFGPLNQAGGWRRLNVAVSRAREEMVVFSTMTSAMIDLGKTSSKGVAGLKAFLEFAEKGRTTLAMRSSLVKKGGGIGKYLAKELATYGYECRYDVGASDFKIDAAVIDPADKRRFVLAILADGARQFSVKDRNVLQVQTLKRGNWNVLRLNSVNYYNNPKREIKRIKDFIDKITGAEKKTGAQIKRYRKEYRFLKTPVESVQTGTFVTEGEHDAEITARLRAIVAQEEPVSRAFLKKRCLASFGIPKSGTRVDARLDALIDACVFFREKVSGVDYYYKNPKAILPLTFRGESGTPVRKTDEDFTPFETAALIRAALEDRVAIYMDELTVLVAGVYGVRVTDKFSLFVRDTVAYGEEKGLFVRSVSDRISLA